MKMVPPWVCTVAEELAGKLIVGLEMLTAYPEVLSLVINELAPNVVAVPRVLNCAKKNV